MKVKKLIPSLLLAITLLAVALTSQTVPFPTHTHRGWEIFEWSFEGDKAPRCVGSRNEKEGILFITAFHCVDDNDNGKLDEWEIKRVLKENQMSLEGGQAFPEQDVFVILKKGYELKTKAFEGKAEVVSSIYGRKITRQAKAFTVPNRDVWWLPQGTPVLVLETTSRRGMSGSPIFDKGRLIGILIGGDGFFTYASPLVITRTN